MIIGALAPGSFAFSLDMETAPLLRGGSAETWGAVFSVKGALGISHWCVIDISLPQFQQLSFVGSCLPLQLVLASYSASPAAASSAVAFLAAAFSAACFTAAFSAATLSSVPFSAAGYSTSWQQLLFSPSFWLGWGSFWAGVGPRCRCSRLLGKGYQLKPSISPGQHASSLAQSKWNSTSALLPVFHWSTTVWNHCIAPSRALAWLFGQLQAGSHSREVSPPWAAGHLLPPTSLVCCIF